MQDSPQSGTGRGPEAPAPERLLYPVNDAAVLLGISPRSTWGLIYSDKLRTVWVGNRRLVPADALQEFVAQLPTERPDLKAAA